MIAELFQQEVVILPLCSGIYPKKKNQFSALHSNINSNGAFIKICTNIVEHTVTKQCYQRYKHSNTDVAYLINPKTFEFAPLHLQEDRAKEFIRKFGLKTQQNETIRKLMAAGALIGEYDFHLHF